MSQTVINEQGFRLNVGIVLINQEKKVLWARRVGKADAWQFPQGGLHVNEAVQEAMYRELKEELGLEPEHVRVLAETKKWMSYRLPRQYQRRNSKPLCVGQKQKWLLLSLESSDESIRLDLAPNPEFDEWRWVDYWYPVEHVIGFKRAVYKKMLAEFAQQLGLREK